MFALRIIEETRENENSPFQQVITNYELGTAYSILKKGITNEFNEEMIKRFPETDQSKIKGLVCAENYFFIEENSENKVFSYFIMTDSGKTFERL